MKEVDGKWILKSDVEFQLNVLSNALTQHDSNCKD